MSINIPHPNQVVSFASNYKDGDDDLTSWRYYLLKEINHKEKQLTFFSITSNRSHPGSSFSSQYKITKPRPPCLESKFYPDSFVNTNRLVIVPLEALPYLKRPLSLEERERDAAPPSLEERGGGRFATNAP